MERVHANYGERRAAFRDGDVLLFRGRGMSSLVIRALTASVYTHVGMVVRYRGRVLCAHATGQGVHLMIMSELARSYAGDIEYYEVLQGGEAARDLALGFVFEQMGKPYDYFSGLRFAWALLLGRMGRQVHNDKWFCSELVAEAYRRAGAPLIRQRPADYIAPAHLRDATGTLRYRYTLG